MAWQSRDIGASLEGAPGIIPNVVTAGGGGDGVEQDGIVIDRLLAGRGLALSCKVIIPWTAILAAAATLSLAANMRESAAVGMTSPTDITRGSKPTQVDAVVATGGGGGTTEDGVTTLDVDLSGAQRFVQVQVTPTLSAAMTDTVAIAAAVVLGGFDELVPAQAAVEVST